MKISVCIKRVPDTATKIRIGGDGKSIDPADVQYIISPYDEFAIEEAIQIKKAAGDGTVTIVCLGPDAAQKNLRQALAMGGDQGVLIRHEESLDPFQTAQALAATLREQAPDVVFFGRQSADGQSAQVGPITARLLGMPCVTDVVSLQRDGDRWLVEREVEGAREKVSVSSPCAFTAQKGLNEPGYPTLKGIMAAKKKPLETVEATISPAQLTVSSLELPPARPEGKIVGEGTEAVAELVRLLREEAKVI